MRLQSAIDRLRRKKRQPEDPIPMSVVARLDNFGPWADQFSCPDCFQKYETVSKTGTITEYFACFRCGETFRPPM